MEKLRIFLVDDDPIFIFLTKKIIDNANIDAEVRTFGNGEDAYKEILANKENPGLLPDLLFIDLNMPVMDGWEFLERYTEIEQSVSKTIDIFLLSSTISPHDFERSTNFSFLSDFLIKPLNKQKILEICQVAV